MPLYVKEGKQLLFLHIPKCAGTSVEKALGDAADSVHLFSPGPSPLLPCSAQHFDLAFLKSLIPDLESLTSVAVVRHPLLRMLSEHQYRNKIRVQKGKETLDLPQQIRLFFFEYQFNKYVFDNHIRPQAEFIAPATEVFRLESGVGKAIDYALRSLGVDYAEREGGGAPQENSSAYDDLSIETSDIARIQAFYEKDFELFGYRRLEVTDKSRISFRELKQELEDPFVRAYRYQAELIPDNDHARGRARYLEKAEATSRFVTKQSLKSLDFIKSLSRRSR